MVAQWLRIARSVQGTQVQSLTGEHPTCLGATQPVPESTALRSLGVAANSPAALRPQQEGARRQR